MLSRPTGIVPIFTKSKLFFSVIFFIGILYLYFNVLKISKRNQRELESRQLPRVCKAGQIYTITSAENLLEQEENLHCIFHLGWEVKRVPEGPFYGEIISVGESHVLNPLIRAIWMGKLVTKVNCRGNVTAYLGWNYFGGPCAPFVASVGILSSITKTSRIYRDNKTALLFDYTLDLKTVCDEMCDKDKKNFPIKEFSPWSRNFWPFTQITDILRPVGKQADGGIIYLGQMYAMNIFRSNKETTPVCFFATVNYDQLAVPQLKVGESMDPFVEDVRYKREDFFDSMAIFLPVNIFNEPIHKARTFATEAWLVLTNGLILAKDYTVAQFTGAKKELRMRMEPPSSLVLPSRKIQRKANYLSSANTLHGHQLEL